MATDPPIPPASSPVVGTAGLDRQRVPDRQEIVAHLDRVTQSAEFDTSQRSVDFLRFIVTMALDGRESMISQHSIAGTVFGRGSRFDPTTDPIVRMQAGRVRRALEHYYLTEGIEDPIRIQLPKGTYVPKFARLKRRLPGRPPASGHTHQPRESWPTLLISPFNNLTGKRDAEFICQGLASDLATEFSRYKSIHVFLSQEGHTASGQPLSVQFELTGSVFLLPEAYKINLHLIDRNSGRQQWAQTQICPAGDDQGSCLAEIVHTTVSLIAEEHGLLSSHFTEVLRKQPTASGTAYEAILRHHHFECTHKPEDFAQAFASLSQAVVSDPDCAICWSYLARLGGIHWSLGGPGDLIPIEDSLKAARRGTELDPSDVRCRVVLAYLLMVNDETDRAYDEAELAFELCGMSTFWLDAVGYLLTLLGDWERGPKLIYRAIGVNPFPRRACYSALWLDALRRDDLQALSVFSRKYAPETFFWSPLMEAVTLVLHNRIEEASVQIDKLLQQKPDFPMQARWLITRYIKSDPLVTRIENALRTAGLE